jgi:hypothetical protein
MQKGLQLSWLGGLSSTPQVLGLTPRGSEFQAGVKKNPLVCSTPKLLTWATVLGGCLTPRRSSFKILTK